MISDRATGPTDSEAPLGDLLPALGPEPPGLESRDLARRLARVEARNVTWTTDDFPVFWSEARGANVVDADGNVFLDLTGAFGVAIAGHGHPAVTEAIRRASGRLVHGMGDVHPPVAKVALLERLSEVTPWPEARGILASAGSEAVEIALKTAQLATGRSGFVAFDGGYHGLTLGALSVTSRDDFRAPFRSRLPGGVRFVPFPAASPGEAHVEAEGIPEAASAPRRVGGCERHLDELDRAFETLREAGDPAAAVIVEPVQGRGGVRVPPRGFLAEVGARARANGALLVFDEIFTGLGRTGSFLAGDVEGVAPDLVCLGKALGGGLPLSCCLGPPDVMDAWPASEGEALHTSTFLGHPLACEASLAVLGVIEREDLVARSRTEGSRLRATLSEALRDVPGVAEVRGRGLFVGIELESRGAGARLAVELLKEGILVLPAGPEGEVVELTPPLNISSRQLDWAVEALARTLLRP